MTTTAQSVFRTPSSATGRLLSLAFFLFLTTAVAALGSIATRSGQDYYESLREPAINPPDWMFGAVWTVLYVFMAVAGWLVFQRRGPNRELALGAWGTQLGLNLLWTYLFFAFESPGLALIEIGVLLAAIVATIALFWRIAKDAALFMVPYALWVAFAAVLNFEYWRLN